MSGLTAVGRMEGIKLRSMGSATWIFAIFVVGMIGLVIWTRASRNPTALTPADRATYDATEPSSRTTDRRACSASLVSWRSPANPPRTDPREARRRAAAAEVLAAKVVVVVAVTPSSARCRFGVFFAGEAALSGCQLQPHASPGEPGVARAA